MWKKTGVRQNSELLLKEGKKQKRHQNRKKVYIFVKNKIAKHINPKQRFREKKNWDKKNR